MFLFFESKFLEPFPESVNGGVNHTPPLEYNPNAIDLGLSRLGWRAKGKEHSTRHNSKS